MARRTTSRRSSRSASSRRRSSAGAGRVSRRSRVSRARRAAPARATTVRVVVQSAPAPVVSAGAVSMETMKRARF